jgi:hypothetical protein
MKHALALLVVTACAGAKPAPARGPDSLDYKGGAESDAPPDRSSPPKAAKGECDAAYQKALAQVRANDYGKALVEVEVAIACEPLPYYQTSAFVFACMSGNAQKASLYYASLPPDQQSLRRLCEKQKPPVAYDEDVASTETASGDDPPPPEEADPADVPARGQSQKPGCSDMAKKSTDFGAAGQFAAALAQAEAAYKCDPLPYHVELAFMFACKSKNQAKAKGHYKKLGAAEQEKFVQICIREGVEVR